MATNTQQKIFGVGELATQTVQGGGNTLKSVQGLSTGGAVATAAANAISNVGAAYLATTAQNKVSKHTTSLRSKLEGLEATGLGATELKNKRRQIINELPVTDTQRKLIDSDPSTQLDRGRVVKMVGDRTITSDSQTNNIANITAPSMIAANRQIAQLEQLEKITPTAVAATDALLAKVLNPTLKGRASTRFKDVIVPRALDLSMNMRRIGDTANTTLPDMLNTSEIEDRAAANGRELTTQYHSLINGFLHPSVSSIYENPTTRPPLDMVKNIVRGINDDLRSMLIADPDIAKESGVDFEKLFANGIKSMEAMSTQVLKEGETGTRKVSLDQISNIMRIENDIFNQKIMNSLPSYMRFMVGSKNAVAAIQSLMALDQAAGNDGTQYAISALRTLGAGTHKYTLAAFKDGITQDNVNGLVGLSNGLPYMETKHLKEYIQILKTVPDYDDKVLSAPDKSLFHSYLILAEKKLKEGNNVGDALTQEQTGAAK